MRTFLAVDLPPTIENRLVQLTSDLKEGFPPQSVRWVDPHVMHVTLKFLGEIKPARLGDIAQSLAPVAAEYPELALRVGGFGVFPNASRPRVLWLGVNDGHGLLAALHSGVERALEQLGFKPEGRRFTPHLTLGRTRDGDRDAVAEQVSGLAHSASFDDIGGFTVDQLTLYKSTLGPSGAVHEIIDTFPLGAAEP
jgi:2'-5' RNA ligase